MKTDKKNKLKLMTHIVAGYPTLSESRELAKLMIDSKVDFLEIQFPFSDPIADGPTLMEANRIALENGTKVTDAFELTKEIALNTKTPILIMTYFNIIFNYGVEDFCKAAKDAGVYGLIVPDMPIDEESYDKLIINCKKHELIHIKLLSPSSSIKRIKMNVQDAQGFIYFTSRDGTTGSTKSLNKDLKSQIENIKKFTDLPIAVGFGISKPEHIKALKDSADIAIIGSAIVNIFNNSKFTGVKKFIDSIKESL